ncbi:hypothetical protein HU200_034563 [Digitaria exilis]|uniref:F-box domain-containing protein n=1 Tax=Digitaria exilis TaxID=1010633 RepID=A0A835BJU9_9POAL|nr:hypothetical protein HU200_034563 [Digitaria exilis]
MKLFRAGQSMGPAQATRKKARSRRRRHRRGEPDRLSALPDCLLHVIMSSLKARQVVQTCVLSKRWRHLWGSVPCLDVDIDEFRTKTTPAAAPGGAHNGGSDDVDWSMSDDYLYGHLFVPKLEGESSNSEDNADAIDGSSESESDEDEGISGSGLESSDSDSRDSCSDDVFSDHEDDKEDGYGGEKDKEWEDFQDFTVSLMHRCDFSQLDSFRLHMSCQRSPGFAQRQVGGWLRRAMKYCTPDPAISQHKGLLRPSPWRLKRLHLCVVGLDNRFMRHVTSVCRTLEDLELHGCACKIQSFTSHSLKSLVLKNCRWSRLSKIASRTLKRLVIDDGQNDGCLLVILTPALAYLHLTVGVFNYCAGISIHDMPSLVKASIDVPDHRTITDEDLKLSGDQYKLLCSVSNAASLELSSLGRKVWCNLGHDFRILRFFLKSSPNLEKLTLRLCRTNLDNTSSSEFLGLDFMCENLKVEIIYKDGDAHQLVKMLLCASGNLSKKYIKLTKVK